MADLEPRAGEYAGPMPHYERHPRTERPTLLADNETFDAYGNIVSTGKKKAAKKATKPRKQATAKRSPKSAQKSAQKSAPKSTAKSAPKKAEKAVKESK